MDGRERDEARDVAGERERERAGGTAAERVAAAARPRVAWKNIQCHNDINPDELH